MLYSKKYVGVGDLDDPCAAGTRYGRSFDSLTLAQDDKIHGLAMT